MDQPAHGAVVTQGQKLLPAGVPRVPGAQGGGRLVWEHDVVLGVIEHGLGHVLLLTRRPCPCVGDQAPAGG